MNKNIKFLNIVFLVLLILAISIFAISCSVDIELADTEVQSISIYSISKVDGYFEGDDLDISNAQLLVIYDNGESEIIDLTDDMIDYDSFDMTISEDEKIITVIYGGASTTFTISVIDTDFTKVAITTMPYKTVYIEGETVDPTGAILSIYYDSGNVVTKYITQDMLSSYSNTLGEQNIFVDFAGDSTLFFKVTFTKKTAVSISIMREPNQKFVFQNYAELLSTDGMKVKITYDNAVTETYENAVASSDSDTETIANSRTAWSENVEDNLYIFIEDSVVTSVIAKVSYIEPNISDEITYSFEGTALVSKGDIVDDETVIATTSYLEDIMSNSEGIVTSVTSESVTVSRYVTYDCNDIYLSEGDIVLDQDILGTQASSNVKTGVSGMVTSVGGGKITIRALPTSSFTINVSDRSYESMEIITIPVTVNGSSIYNIIQGDTLDLSTGLVRVTFDNGEVVDYSMDNTTFIQVINASTNFRSEIEGLTFTGVDDKTFVAAGESYDLEYEIEYTDEVESSHTSDNTVVTVSVVDENGNINVVDNRTIVPEEGKNYTVSIVVTYTDLEGATYVSETSYQIHAEGAEYTADQLDISAAGSHTLNIEYAGISDNYITMDITVIQKVPVDIIIEDSTNNISNKSFYLGESLPFTTICYRIVYSNGDVTEDLINVNKSMVVNSSDGISDTLVCESIGDDNYIVIAVPDYSDIIKTLYFDIIAVPIISLNITTDPTDSFLTGKGVSGGGIDGVTSIDLSGSVISVSYEMGTSSILCDTAEYTMDQLIANGKNDIMPNIKLVYSENDVDDLSITQIYDEDICYTASLTYTDSYGESFSTDVDYYIVSNKPTSIKVSAKIYEGVWQYESEYIQCQDWDFTGISLIVTYDGDDNSTITETIDLEDYMVYNTTTNEVGTEIPLIIRYLGQLEEEPSLTFNVTEREETGISITKMYKTQYVTTDSGLDLSEYQFAISYNAGTSKAVNGIYSFTGDATTKGWWYEVYDAEISDGDTEPTAVLDSGGNLTSSTMRIVGYKMIRLQHTSEYESTDSDGETRYNIKYVDFYIYVDYKDTEIVSIAFEDTDTYVDGIPVLGTFAAGMPLIYTYYDDVEYTLSEKYLTIYYEDDTTGTIELSNSNVSINYYTSDKTTGIREVTMNYNESTCKFYVYVENATLVDISLTNIPTTDYINGDSISIDGGILQATFENNDTGEYFSNYVLMNEDTELLSYGDNGSTSSGEISSEIDEYDDYGEYIEYVQKSITISYGTEINNKSTEYTVTIYNKQDVEFTYGNVIFFYGNSKAAIATSQQVISEFDLPDDSDITLNYVSNEYFLYYTEEEYANALVSNSNLIEIVTLDSDGNEVICYVDSTNVIKPTDSPSRPYTPATSGYTYYLLMSVSGNQYYRTRNYCYQTYLIIPKVVEVNVVSSNELAFIKRISTSNNPTAISYLYSEINSINSKYTAALLDGEANPDYHSFIQSIALASPNSDYFEILMTLSSSYDEATDRTTVETILASIQGQINSQASVLSSELIEGVNIAEYNGGQPEYITYTISSGETLTLGGVLELLNGKLEISVTDGIYGIGDYSVNNDNDTLYHNNYNIDLVTDKYTVFTVTTNTVSSVTVENIVGDTLTISLGDSINVQATPVDGDARIINSYELSYYTEESHSEESLIDGDITSAGTYYAILDIGYYINEDGSDYALQFTVVVTE
jgi:hypothetical protein